MFDPVMADLQRKLFQSVFSDLINILTGKRASGVHGGGNLTARPSEFDSMLEDAALKYDLDPALLKAVAQAESNFSSNAVSHAGAKGVMQLMDGTAQDLGVANSFDPAQNIDGGARYLKQLLNRYQGDPTLALAAYNAGPGAVDKWGGLPPYSETQAYIPRVLNLRDQYRTWTA